MHVLHVSWEYPPLVYGGLGRHVHALAEAQASLGHQVTVLTQQGAGSRATEVVNGVSVIRVEPPTPTVPREPDQLIEWVDDLDQRMAARGCEIIGTLNPDVVHAHDWVVAQAASAMRRRCSAPLIVTVHATEAGRHQGWITSDLSRKVHRIEYILTSQAQRVIACSRAMSTEVQTLFDIPTDRVDVIPNGIDLRRWQVAPSEQASARDQWANGPLVVFIGRLEWEKGVHTLLDATPRIIAEHPGTRVVIAGTGTYEAALKAQAYDLVSDGTVRFAGWLPEIELQALAAAADVIVVPSLYEPFGLVALEAGALGVPLVVADTGGLADIVEDRQTGRIFAKGNADHLTDAVLELLRDPPGAELMAKRMQSVLRQRYDWRTIAAETVHTYAAAIAQLPDHPRPFDVTPSIVPPSNLFTGEPAGP